MKYFLLVAFLCLLSCAKRHGTDLYKALEEFSCPNESDFGGIGIGESESAALAQARSNMAQEHFAEKLKSNVQISGQNINGVASTSTAVSIDQEAALANPQDAKLHYSKRQGGQIGVAVCLTRADAAKGFLESQRLVLDSLELASNAALATEHPRHKNEAWHKTQAYHNRIVAIQNLLSGWGFAKEDYFGKANEVYAKTKDYYKGYCRDVKIFWQDARDECSETAFTVLSKKIKMEKSRCSGGLKLSFNCPEKCTGSPLGIECSFNPSLALESCGGEKYSMLKIKEPIIGLDAYNKNVAKENLIENLLGAAFFNEWEREIMEWVPQCAE
jgi:hypothetical protein